MVYVSIILIFNLIIIDNNINATPNTNNIGRYDINMLVLPPVISTKSKITTTNVPKNNNLVFVTLLLQ